MAERQSTVVNNNLLLSVVLCFAYTLQLIFNSLQQCYMPYGYMFSNDSPCRESSTYQRKTTSIFEILDLNDDIEVTAFALRECAEIF